MPDRTSRWASLAGLPTLIVVLTSAATVWAQATPEALSARFRQASRQTLPAVVTVRHQAINPTLEPTDLVDRTIREGGSGVVVDAPRGLVVTNDHVIAGATRGVVVILPNGRERVASQIWRDPKSDLALLAIDPTDLVAAPWGDSDQLDIGDWVLAIGGPFGLTGTVTAGIVSGKGRGIGMALYEDLIQTDAAINPGNSGGPLINLQGEVVGINTALKSNGGGYEGVGFAVPSSRARRVVAELAEFGRVRRAYLGITIRPLDALTANRLNITDGAVVASVVVGSPASTAGLQPGDVILTVGGQPTGGSGRLQGMIEVAEVGEPLDLTVDRRGQILAIQVRPGPQPDAFGLPGPRLEPTTTTLIQPQIVVPPPFQPEVFVPIPRPRGLHINVPGLNMRLPGPDLDITRFGVRRPPPVVFPPAPIVLPGLSYLPGETVIQGPTIVPPATPVPAPAPIIESEPDLHPVDPAPAPSPTLDPLPTPVETSSRSASFPSIGLNLAEPNPTLLERFHLDRGISGLVITSVDLASPADRGGLEAGMLLTDAGGKLVGNVADFRRAITDRPPGRDLLVRIRKGAKAEFRVVVAPEDSTTPSPAEPELGPLPPAIPRSL